MIDWIVKKVIVSKINDLLKTYKGNVEKTRQTLKRWITRIENVLECFKSMLAKLDDNIIDADELKQAADDVTKLVKEW